MNMTTESKYWQNLADKADKIYRLAVADGWADGAQHWKKRRNGWQRKANQLVKLEKV